MGMGMIFSALSGAANGLAESDRQKQKVEDESRLMRERSELEEQKALRLDSIMRGRNREEIDYKRDQAEAPAKRFGGLIGSKMAEDVPVEAAAVTKSTSEGAKAAGLKDGLVGMTREQVMAYNDPDMLAQYDKQMGEDKRLASEKVAGQTRKRTQSEAIKAALDESLTKDPSAFAAGRALTAPDKGDLEERKMESREKIERARIEQRDRSDDKRFESMMARIESAGGGKNGNKTALIQNAEYLKTLGYSDDKIEKFIFEKKEIPLEDVAAKILAADKFGEMTPEQAAQKAIGLRNALNGASDSKSAPKAAVPELPSGAKKIGTSGGKDVYQTPDGKKFIKN